MGGPPLAAPFAEFEIGQVNKADEINGAQHNGGADLADVMQNVVVEELANEAADARSIERHLQIHQPSSISLEQAGQAHATEQQHRAPQPAPLQVRQEPKKITQAEHQQQ